jgi:hypothetical protein
MIEFTNKNKFINNTRLTSFSITYPRTVTFFTGNYPRLDILHNLRLKIKNNLSKETTNKTYVRGGMTDWAFFIHDKDFSIFFTDIMNHYKPILACDFILKKDLNLIDAWGNLLKKGEHVQVHKHNHFHGVLYLTEGIPLIFPEMEMVFDPKPGDWIISPPEILHGTDAVESDEERINVVFNFELNDNFRSVNQPT